jgi:hypothetical protein
MLRCKCDSVKLSKCSLIASVRITRVPTAHIPMGGLDCITLTCRSPPTPALRRKMVFEREELPEPAGRSCVLRVVPPG